MLDEPLPYYEQELSHLRFLGQEFAAQYPKIASRLLIEGDNCEDPHTERLIEAFSFLSARVHKKLDDEFPEIVEFLQQHKISSHPGKGPGQLLKLLAKGRLCAYATLEEAGDTAIAAQTEQFEKLAPPLARKDYYLLVNPHFYHALQPQIEAL